MKDALFIFLVAVALALLNSALFGAGVSFELALLAIGVSSVLYVCAILIAKGLRFLFSILTH